MKIFFDTCAIVDYLCNRKEAQLVDEILSNAEAKEWECFISGFGRLLSVSCRHCRFV